MNYRDITCIDRSLSPTTSLCSSSVFLGLNRESCDLKPCLSIIGALVHESCDEKNFGRVSVPSIFYNIYLYRLVHVSERKTIYWF